MKAPKERGRGLVESLVAVLASPDSPIANAPGEYVALISRALGAEGPAGPGGGS